MSGSSLDGLDIAYVQLEEVRGRWAYEVLQAICVPYSNEWLPRLKAAGTMPVADFLRLHSAYGRYLGEQVQQFMDKHDLEHKVHFIASHGHTVLHEPNEHSTFQIGEGAQIAAITGLPVISDLRSVDVALGGQGAPIVPIADTLLWGQHDYLLNIGGIANITIKQDGKMFAFDVCAANQILNVLAAREGQPMDIDGNMARSGNLLFDLADQLLADAWCQKPAPKSLSNEAAMATVAVLTIDDKHRTADLLHTATVHIARCIADAIRAYGNIDARATMLVTGGGAFNRFLIEELTQQTAELGVEVIVPEDTTVQYKEAIAMALIGTLRWREEANVLASVTGAVRDSIGGAIWLPG
jgi:anhydro-N-acetylmuramic acid kinase